MDDELAKKLLIEVSAASANMRVLDAAMANINYTLLLAIADLHHLLAEKGLQTKEQAMTRLRERDRAERGGSRTKPPPQLQDLLDAIEHGGWAKAAMAKLPTEGNA